MSYRATKASFGITPDGRYLFFCTSDYTEEGIVGEYYWVDTSVIQRMSPDNAGR